MPNKNHPSEDASVAAWAKRCYFAGRAAMEAVLRPYGLGATQWYVLHRLATEGPTMQRDLLSLLQVERATLSAILGTLVRKGLVEQVPDRIDQRQKRLTLTAEGAKLWDTLPDLVFIRETAFGDLDPDDIAAAIRVLRTATERLDELISKGKS
ncbi:MarR family winged helix-turn-helix transcriptional regulator [Acuticoccus sediminis]|uniref:MarR family winged helix-turn-helix transcriptional regulator n=1 Tax=Acuticoccus sediminis TaxID=2184697 RepID=UPI00299E2881|nr:MarR family transcriptional regulator [Acuticoccus sediminis]